jgi:hypothetical protein
MALTIQGIAEINSAMDDARQVNETLHEVAGLFVE